MVFFALKIAVIIITAVLVARRNKNKEKKLKNDADEVLSIPMTEYAALRPQTISVTNESKEGSTQVIRTIFRRFMIQYRPVATKSSLGPSDESKKRGTHSSMRPKWEIDYESITLNEEIGRGSFGVVYKGLWRNAVVAGT